MASNRRGIGSAHEESLAQLLLLGRADTERVGEVPLDPAVGGVHLGEGRVEIGRVHSEHRDQQVGIPAGGGEVVEDRLQSGDEALIGEQLVARVVTD